jgi:hypothetical protein
MAKIFAERDFRRRIVKYSFGPFVLDPHLRVLLR